MVSGRSLAVGGNRLGLGLRGAEEGPLFSSSSILRGKTDNFDCKCWVGEGLMKCSAGTEFAMTSGHGDSAQENVGPLLLEVEFQILS